MMLVLFTLAVQSDVDPDLMLSVEIFWTQPTLVLNFAIVHLVEMSEILAPHCCFEIWTDPTFAIMVGPHETSMIVEVLPALEVLSAGQAGGQVRPLDVDRVELLDVECQ